MLLSILRRLDQWVPNYRRLDWKGSNPRDDHRHPERAPPTCPALFHGLCCQQKQMTAYWNETNSTFRDDKAHFSCQRRNTPGSLGAGGGFGTTPSSNNAASVLPFPASLVFKEQISKRLYITYFHQLKIKRKTTSQPLKLLNCALAKLYKILMSSYGQRK